ncbi:MAG: phosphoenolpyruvate--protein phosphotransferase [Spirochaetales bacterium]|nr:phosphoenolpyruvate--protein phosphotransferase [Spirochaetales bacterium]
MKTLTGISASPGIAIGVVFYYHDETIKVPKYTIGKVEVKSEKKRFGEATARARDELLALKETSTNGKVEDQSRFLDSHILMLEDPEFTGNIERNLEKDLKNVEWILLEEIDNLVRRLESSDDVYLKERVLDIRDVSKRVLNHLLFTERISLVDLESEVILVTHNLLPSDALALYKGKVKGIAMDAGGKTSHTAILARAFEIPAVLGLSEITQEVRTGDEVIVDGNKGIVIVKPDAATKRRYRDSLRVYHAREIELLTLNDLPAESKDGKLIKLMANIEVPEETESALSHGADGIGLFRSEFLFLRSNALPSEDEQYDAYSRVLKAMGGKKVTIRTLDLGGDKTLAGIKDIKEANPILGWRAIRFCLSRGDIFLSQLRALLRASVYGNLQIMFPMISGVEELEKALEALENAKDSLRRDGIDFAENIPVGIMVETPSAALTSDILAKQVNFFSIGTNDLIQYTIAVDRGNERIAYLYEPFHPGVLRLIKVVVDYAHAAGIPAHMCGEMAGDPIATVILLGLGLDGLSMSAFSIPEVKKIIRTVSIWDAEELVGTISEMRSVVEIDNYVNNWMHERFDIVTA